MNRAEFENLPLGVKMQLWKNYYRYYHKNGMSMDEYLSRLERTVTYGGEK